MKASRLPVLRCHANCPNCGLPAEFRMFESGGGGDFSTFVGAATGTLYRLDLGKITYLNLTEADLLAAAQEKEGNLIRVPESLRCKMCGTKFSARISMGDGEEFVDAYEL